MRYDFTSIMDRHLKDAIAVDGPGTIAFAPKGPKEGYDVIPMWVADMNFPTAPSIVDAIVERAKHPAFGYFMPQKAYFDAIIDWQARHNGVQGLEAHHIGYANGVLAAVVAAANVLCSKGDNILVHSPTYVGFTHSLGDNGYNLVGSPLVLDEKGVWRMDYADMEEKIKSMHIHCAVLCSPHNPCGRVWEQWELEKAMALFKKYDVYVISDEIWSDLILTGYQHIPTQSVSEDAKMRTVGVYAPSKTFNLAGLVGSYTIIYNDWLRDRVDKEMSLSHCNGMNVLSMHALMGAYLGDGDAWLAELRQVLTANADYACKFISEHFAGVTVQKPQGTYMLFVDCTKWCESHGKTIDELEERLWSVGVTVQDGRQFHGPCHIRMNLALPLSRVQEAFRRMDELVFNGQW